MTLIRDITPPPECTVRFISDLHLAHKRSRAPQPELFAKMMDGVDLLILCGDTAETRETCAEREHSLALRHELRERCLARGIETIELAGNHDPDIELQMVRLNGGRIVAMHGHALLSAVSPWSREYLRCKKDIQSLIRSHPKAFHSLTDRLELTRLISIELGKNVPPAEPARVTSVGRLIREIHHCFWPPQRPLNVVTAWLTCGVRAELFARRYVPEAHLLIIGHFHRGGRWQFGSRTILNTGAWFEHATPYAVDVRNGTLLRYFPLHPSCCGC